MEIYISLISLFIAVGSIVLTIITYLQTVKHDRKQATLDAYNTLQEQSLDILNNYSSAEIRDIVKNKTDKLLELNRCLARIEHFSVDVNTKIYDPKVVYELAHGYPDVGVWYKLNPLLNKKNRQEDFYKNYRTLVDNLKSIEEQRKSKSSISNP